MDTPIETLDTPAPRNDRRLIETPHDALIVGILLYGAVASVQVATRATTETIKYVKAKRAEKAAKKDQTQD